MHCPVRPREERGTTAYKDKSILNLSHQYVQQENSWLSAFMNNHLVATWQALQRRIDVEENRPLLLATDHNIL